MQNDFKFTGSPGPWEAIPSTLTKNWIIIGLDSARTRIATVLNVNDEVDLFEYSKSNAKLFAVAPEMFALLADFYNACREEYSHDEWTKLLERKDDIPARIVDILKRASNED